jgi:hypothetical protein
MLKQFLSVRNYGSELYYLYGDGADVNSPAKLFLPDLQTMHNSLTYCFID